MSKILLLNRFTLDVSFKVRYHCTSGEQLSDFNRMFPFASCGAIFLQIVNCFFPDPLYNKENVIKYMDFPELFERRWYIWQEKC